ncbi:hypothetical protein A9G09_11510 [Gilliamella sp. wkB292]|uniref:hypothetical protein n=1 Tax=Gilliamella sp. wkB292 TaxID=3120262 RepID=UPI00080EE583|nr:hypothetical protein [Gilliamella apicola]OCG10922.1 hypothetical protein A9G09_11510 [Gilliamella apicola]
MSAQTVNAIKGNAPYISFNGLTKNTDITPLLRIILPDGKKVTPDNDVSTSAKPIQLVTSKAKFSDIQTFVSPPNSNSSYPQYPLTQIITTSNYWGDRDGDGQPTVTGNIALNWYDYEGNNITTFVKNNFNSELEGCNAPYKLTLSIPLAGFISTKYGIPNSSVYRGGSKSYYLYPKVDSLAKFCYAKPNLASEEDVGDNWKYGKGFYSYDPSNPENNFPTTGSNNLFFDLKVAGLSATELININGSSVGQVSGSGVSLSLSNYGGLLRVSLKGPSLSSNGGVFTPSTFRLYADKSKTIVFYTFKISRWYIGIPGASGGYVNSENRCNSLNGGYRLPGVLDLTNSNRVTDGSGNNINWNNGVPGVKEVDRRLISYRNSSGQWMGGLFSEWGSVTNDYYVGSDWDNYHDPYFGGAYYWTSDLRSDQNHYVVDARNGVIGNRGNEEPNYLTACVTP